MRDLKALQILASNFDPSIDFNNRYTVSKVLSNGCLAVANIDSCFVFQPETQSLPARIDFICSGSYSRSRLRYGALI